MLNNNNIILWDWYSKSILLNISAYTNLFTYVVFLSDGRLAGQGSTDSTKIWNTNTGVAEFTLNKDCTALEQLDNGYLVTTGTSNNLFVWNAINGTLVNTIVTSVASSFFSIMKQVNSNNLLAIGDSSGSIWIYDMNSYNLAGKLSNHTDLIASLEIMPSGHLISGSYDSKIVVWNVTTRSVISSLNPFNNYIYTIKMISNYTFAVCGITFNVYIININPLTFQMTLNKTFSTGNSFAKDIKLANSDLLLVAFNNGSIGYYNISTSLMIATFTYGSATVYAKNFALLSIRICKKEILAILVTLSFFKQR